MRYIFLIIFLFVTALGFSQPWKEHGPLKTSSDGHFIEHKDGTPFLWLGSTEWALHQNLSKEDVEFYLDNTKSAGFSVIQLFTASGWALGKEKKNFYGDAPYINDDATHLNPAYWNHLSWVIDQCAKRGFYVLLVYGPPVRKDESLPFIKTKEEAYKYGQSVGHILKDKPNIIWCSGIDMAPDDTVKLGPMEFEGWNAIAEGVADGVNNENKFDGKADYSTTYMTYHPAGGWTSSAWFHNAEWCDFNSSQVGYRGWNNCEDVLVTAVKYDYALNPSKPTVNLEPWYEGCKWIKPAVDAWLVRVQAYQTIFAGAGGFSYGNSCIYSFDSTTEDCDHSWKYALSDTGRLQMKNVMRLLKIFPFEKRIPNQGILSSTFYNCHITNELESHIAAVRASDGSYAMVYSPEGAWFSVDLKNIDGSKAQAKWYNPRTGAFTDIGIFSTRSIEKFTPPGEMKRGNDWILLLKKIK
ncbi:MAG TPA: glycoside hydrolase family 140 protein [Flavitalea sp.]|nr:glycoside hydrolase family 140 protein [Flavitalea sp.]